MLPPRFRTDLSESSAARRGRSTTCVRHRPGVPAGRVRGTRAADLRRERARGAGGNSLSGAEREGVDELCRRRARRLRDLATDGVVLAAHRQPGRIARHRDGDRQGGDRRGIVDAHLFFHEPGTVAGHYAGDRGAAAGRVRDGQCHRGRMRRRRAIAGRIDGHRRVAERRRRGGRERQGTRVPRR